MFFDLFGVGSEPEEEPKAKTPAKPKRKSVHKDIRAALHKLQDGRCKYCGVEQEAAYMQVDHIKPVAGKGKNDFRNYQVLCSSCNGRKSNKLTDGQFRKKYGLVPARSPEAKEPPKERIPLKHFDDIDKAEKAKKRRVASKKKRAAERQPTQERPPSEDDLDIFSGYFR